MSGWLVVERQRAPSGEPMEFRGIVVSTQVSFCSPLSLKATVGRYRK